jgi:hypothetical protein
MTLSRRRGERQLAFRNRRMAAAPHRGGSLFQLGDLHE